MQVFSNLKMNLVLTGQEVFLAGDISLPLSSLGLPPHIQSFPNTATWQIEVLRYYEEESRIYGHVNAYHIGNRGFLPSQDKIPFLSDLKRISLSSINTTMLMKTLLGEEGVNAILEQNLLMIQKTQGDEDMAEEPIPYHQDFLKELPEEAYMEEIETNTIIITKEIRHTYKVPIKDLKFRYGGISFLKYLRDTGRNEEVMIHNQELREEFDAVKNYFSNILKTKSITANVVFMLKNNVVEKIRAWSPEISRIDSETIQSVKFELVDKIRKPRFWIDTERNLFTAEDMLDEFLNLEGRKSTLFADDRELFEHLLTIKEAKHYRHLRYLSSRHAHDIMRLRFVIRPFSFVFLVEGEKNHYIIWETLDSEEATYIWHTVKERALLKLQLQKVEEIINTVKVLGKTAYINSKTDENFRRILHDYTDPLSGFIKWKGEIDQCII